MPLLKKNLLDLIELYKTDSRPCVAVKNKFLAEILETLDIKFVNLDGYKGVPTLKELEQAYKSKDIAQTKVDLYFYWIKRNRPCGSIHYE